MEFLNRIEVKGVVGSSRTTTLDNIQTVNFSIATEYCYTDKTGMGVVETTWFTVRGFKGEGISQETIDNLNRGRNVLVIGRIRQHRYVDGNGSEQIIDEIIAQEVTIINK